MTQPTFESTDNLQPSSTSIPREGSIALLEDSGAWKPRTEKAVEPVKMGSQEFKDVMKTYDQAPDKVAALKVLGSKFEQAITASDADIHKLHSDLEDPNFKAQYEKAIEKMDAAKRTIEEELRELPPAECSKAKSALKTLAQLDRDDPLRIAMEKVLVDKYPVMVHSLKELETQLRDPSFQKRLVLSVDREVAFNNAVLNRLGYAQILSATGFGTEAERYNSEAATMLGLRGDNKYVRPESVTQHER